MMIISSRVPRYDWLEFRATQLAVTGDIVHTQQKNALAARNAFVAVLGVDFGLS